MHNFTVRHSSKTSKTFRALVRQEPADRHAHHPLFQRQAAETGDKIRQPPVIALRLGNPLLAAIHVRIVMQFNVKVGRIHPAVRANGAHLRAAQNQLAQHYVNIVQMGVKRLAAEHLSGLGLPEGMADDHHLPPCAAGVRRVSHHTVANGINGIAQIGIAPAVAVPVLAHVAGAFHAQAAGPVIAVAVRLAYRKIKTVAKGDERELAVPPGHVDGSALADKRGPGQKNQRQQ